MADTGWKSPGTVVDDSAIGSVAWGNPDYAKASDDSRATVLEFVNSLSTHYLKATNFSFNIPVGSTINGILVEIEKSAPESDDYSWVVDGSVKIVKSNGSIGTTNKADSSTHWLISDSYISYGSNSDLWGESWTSSDINDSDFGVVISASLTVDHSVTAQIDHIQMKVYYTENTTPIVGEKYPLPPFRRSV